MLLSTKQGPQSVFDPVRAGQGRFMVSDSQKAPVRLSQTVFQRGHLAVPTGGDADIIK